MNIKIVTIKGVGNIIAEIDCTGEKEISLKEPLQVIIQKGKDGEPTGGFLPFMDFVTEFNTGIKISMNDILCITTPSEELVKSYARVFSNIEIASTIPKI